MSRKAGSTLHIKVPLDFDLPTVVVSYGYYMLAPNRWDKQRQAFARPLNLPDAGLGRVAVCITQPGGVGEPLRVACEQRLAREHQQAVRQQVSRMLRTGEDLRGWYRLHRPARKRRFGRLFRSPTLFEDMVKTITGCNVAWRNTITMNQRLCEHVGEGGFPTPGQLAATTEAQLKRDCRVGYRAERIRRLADDVASGRLDLARFDQPERTSEDLLADLRRIHGIGPYAAANILHHLGRYDHVAIDSETYRHYCQAKGIDRPKNPAALDAAIRAHYDAFQPYAFLAYWYELWTGEYYAPLRGEG